MSKSRTARGEPIARDVRQLPANPSLEYERKEAKALLRQLRAGDTAGVSRVRSAHPIALRDRSPSELRLSDAQHVIAREYGFASWPKLVAYFAEMERHRNAPRHNSGSVGVDWLEENVGSTIRRHQRGDVFVGRMLARFVPRFFGRPIAEILATPITEDDARLVVAREQRRVSWNELIERVSASQVQHDREGPWESRDTPFVRAYRAIADHDIPALHALVDAHPELVQPAVTDLEWRRTLVRSAIGVEYRKRTLEARRVTEFIGSLGFDIQVELNLQLLGWPGEAGDPELVRWLLERGADPDWMPPNGISVLEHALVRHRNAECVDLIAQRVTPARAFWVAAALGDVDGVRRYLAGKGKVRAEARRNRPDFMAMGAFEWAHLPLNPEADDLEIMGEAFVVAAYNQRWAAMDVLLDAGFPIDHDKPLGFPLIGYAVGNFGPPALAEYLVNRGADLDQSLGQWGTPREMARGHVLRNPRDEKARQLAAICGVGSVEQILAEVDAKRQSPPPPSASAMRTLRLAADDAARMAQSAVSTENMVVALLRVALDVPPVLFPSVFSYSGADMPRLRTLLEARLLPDADPLMGQELPADAGAEAAVRAAAAVADERRRDAVTPFHLLAGIVSQPSEPGVRLLEQVGATVEKIREHLKQNL